eukprot:15089039-Alexandrium_andersonii.AAC.1
MSAAAFCPACRSFVWSSLSASGSSSSPSPMGSCSSIRASPSFSRSVGSLVSTSLRASAMSFGGTAALHLPGL